MRPALSKERQPVSIPETTLWPGDRPQEGIRDDGVVEGHATLQENKETRYNNEEFDPGSG